MQYLIPYGVLVFLGLGAIGLFASLVQLVRSSIRAPKPRPVSDPDQFREMVTSTRSALMELQNILSTDIGSGAFGTSPIPGAALVGRAEIELLQRVKKYQLVRPAPLQEEVKIH